MAECETCHYHANGGPRVACCNCGDTQASPQLQHCTPRTQKGKGVKTLLRTLPYYTPSCMLVQDPKESKIAWDVITMSTPSASIFARPCPITPRHGFVESRVVKSAAAAANLLKEAQEVDPQAELLLMPLINAKWNLIFTPGRMAIGPGRDGATGGKGSVSFPLAATVDPQIQKLLVSSDITADQSPYLEVVMAGDMGSISVTQLRGGPKCAAGVDYIPAPMTVLAVVEPEEDLLQWEQTVKGLKPGTVVYGEGHTLASHAAVHCVTQGTPFFTSRKPLVGERLTPNLGVPWSLPALKAGLGYAAMQTLSTNGEQDILAILYGMHHAVAMQGEEAFWIGYAAGLMMRYGLAAAMGEWRHRHWPPPKAVRNRDQIYKQVLSSGRWLQYRKRLRRITRGYFVLPWGGAFGGPKWGRCAYSLFALDNGIQGVLRAKTAGAGQAAALKMLAALNLAVDQAHNGGWWLGKFGASVSQFTDASSGGWLLYANLLPLLLKTRADATAQWDLAVTTAEQWARRKRLTTRYLFRFTARKLEVKLEGGTTLSYHVLGRKGEVAEVHIAVPRPATLSIGSYTTGIRVKRKKVGGEVIYRFFYGDADLGHAVMYKVSGK